MRHSALLRWVLVFSAASTLGVACGKDAEPRAATRTPLAGGAVTETTSGQEFLLPDLQTMPFRELFITSDGAGMRILRFSTSVLNAGSGPLEMTGTPNVATGVIVATQNIARADGGAEGREVGRFLFHPGHAHWHLADFTMLEAWTYDDSGELDELLATTGKGTFCAVDEVPELGHAPPPVYLSCGDGIQGISAGWSDTYAAAIAGQELDISGLEDGRYALRSTVDPDNRLTEADDTNNSITVYVEIRDDVIDKLSNPTTND